MTEVTVYGPRPLTVVEAALKLHRLGAWLQGLRLYDRGDVPAYWEVTVCSGVSSAVVAGSDAEDAVRTAILLATAWSKGRNAVVERASAQEGESP